MSGDPAHRESVALPIKGSGQVHDSDGNVLSGSGRVVLDAQHGCLGVGADRGARSTLRSRDQAVKSPLDFH